MGLLQKAIETYDAMQHLIGESNEGKEPLAPVGHMVTKADIEITIDADGDFVQARKVGKDEGKIPIPVTESSSGRTSAPSAHSLCDYLSYISYLYPDKQKLFLDNLNSWVSQSSDAKLDAVLCYVQKNTLLSDYNGPRELDQR